MTAVSDTDIQELKQFINDSLNSLKLEWKEDIKFSDRILLSEQTFPTKKCF